MFGKVRETPQTENTPFHPRSPYGITKVAGFDLTRNFRESYDIFACSGILFNHESPRRGGEFVTRKITQNIARIKKGQDNVLILGNIDAKRDWGYSRDYVEAMWLMLQQKEPKDYVIARGQSYSVSDFIFEAFMCVGIKDYKRYIKIDESLKRPADVTNLCGDASLAHRELNWQPEVNFPELVAMMVDADLKILNKK
jgi:GDPmannose 4,6-dehydratase